MKREIIIERTVQAINQLPKEKAIEISDFADFILMKYEDELLTKNLQKLTAESKAFDFLNEEEDLYTLADAEKLYND